MDKEDLQRSAHYYLTKKGCTSIPQSYTAYQVEKMLVEFTLLNKNKNKDSSVVSDDFIKGWDARERQLRDNGWLKDDYDVYGSGYSSDELIKYSKK